MLIKGRYALIAVRRVQIIYATTKVKKSSIACKKTLLFLEGAIYGRGDADSRRLYMGGEMRTQGSYMKRAMRKEPSNTI